MSVVSDTILMVRRPQDDMVIPMAVARETFESDWRPLGYRLVEEDPAEPAPAEPENGDRKRRP